MLSHKSYNIKAPPGSGTSLGQASWIGFLQLDRAPRVPGGLVVLTGGRVTATDEDSALQFKRKPRPLLDVSVRKWTRSRLELVRIGGGIVRPQNFPRIVDVLTSNSWNSTVSRSMEHKDKQEIYGKGKGKVHVYGATITANRASAALSLHTKP